MHGISLVRRCLRRLRPSQRRWSGSRRRPCWPESPLLTLTKTLAVAVAGGDVAADAAGVVWWMKSAKINDEAALFLTTGKSKSNDCAVE
jgi:hypothetical protein